MAQSNVIREFLVQLGFRVDQTGMQNFISGIKQATKAVLALGAAIEAMAATVALGIQRFASNLEQLYFASIRTGSSATNLLAFDRAMQNFGASAGEGVAMVEQLAHILRTDPGKVAWLENFIGPVKRLKDGTIDAENALERLSKSASFRGQPDFVKYQIGAQFGLTDAQVMRLMNGDFTKELARVRAEVSRMNLEKATEDAHRFMTVWRDFTTIIQQFGIQIYDAISKKLGGGLERLRDWVQEHGPEMAKRIAGVLDKLLTLAERIGPWILKILDWLVDMDKKTDGWSTKLGILLVLLGKFGGLQIITGVLQLAAAFLKLGGGIVGVATGLSTLLDLVHAFTGKGPGGLATWVVDSIPGFGEFLDRVGSKMGFEKDKERFAKENPLQFILDQANGRLSREQAIGLLSQFKAESNLDPNAKQKGGPGYGIAQWEPARQADFKAWAGHDIHGTGTAEQMLFSLHELLDDKGRYRKAGILLQGMNNSAAASDLLTRQYEIPKNVDSAAADRSRIALQMDQQNTFYIDGTKDPRAIGQLTERALDSSNAKLARSFSPAMK